MSLLYCNVVNDNINNINNTKNINYINSSKFEINPSTINFNNCLCRKNKSSGINLQCPHKKYENEIYCEKHIISSWKCSVFDIPDKKIIDYHLTKNKSESEYILIDNYIKNQSLNYNLPILKNTCKKYELKITGKKNEIQNRLKEYFNKFLFYHNNLDKIILLQKNIKKFLLNKQIELRGPGFSNRKIVNNQEDFFTFELLEDIPNKFFFSYKDLDGFIYGYDIRSFKQLVEKKMSNPYNRNKIPDYAIKNMKTIYKKYKLNKNDENKKKEKTTPEQRLNHLVLKVFQQIEQVGAYAGGLNINWFKELSVQQLKKYYKGLEDIWNYRAELNQTQKFKISGNVQMFPVSVSMYFKINRIDKLRTILLKEMEKMVFNGENNEYKSLGAYYILIGLCDVSEECKMAMPWILP